MKTQLIKYINDVLDTNVIYILLGIVVSVVIGVAFNTMRPEIGLGLITSFGVVIVVLKFLYDKEKDKKAEVIELVTFFRKEVMTVHEAFISASLEIEGQHIFFLE